MTRIVVLVLALVLPVAAAAQAPTGNTPPGNSAIDEYMETIPTVTGTTGVGGGQRDGAAAPGSVLGPEERAALEQRGADGEALVALVDETSPAAGGDGAGGNAARGGAPAPAERVLPDEGASAQSPLAATLAAAVGQDDGGGLGPLLPLILVGSLAGVTALLLLRRRA